MPPDPGAGAYLAQLLAVTCPRCRAQPGAWCTTVSGRRAPLLHSRRQRAAGHPRP